MYKIYIYFIFFFLFSCANYAVTSSNHKEMLVTPLPMPNSVEEWEFSHYKTDINGINIAVHQWKRGEDFFMGNVFFDYKVNVKDYANFVNEIDRQDCPQMKSKIIKLRIENNYATATWESQCIISDNLVQSIINKVIRGNYSSYHARRFWNSNLPAEDRKIWLEYFSTIEVCDLNRNEHPCPFNYEDYHSIIND